MKSSHRAHTHDTCEQANLEEHSDDGHHCQSSVGQLRRKFFGLLSRVAGGQDLEAEVARCGCGASRLILGNLAECHVGKNLSPTCGRNFRDRCKTVWHVSELQPGRRRKVSRELASDPRMFKPMFRRSSRSSRIKAHINNSVARSNDEHNRTTPANTEG